MTSLSSTASWVIVNKLTNQAVIEMYDFNLVKKINTMKYKAVPILEYLQTFNSEVKA